MESGELDDKWSSSYIYFVLKQWYLNIIFLGPEKYSRPSVWLVYYGCFELVLESLRKKSHSCKFGIIKGGFLFLY